MDGYIEGHELNQDVEYFADVFVYATEDLDNQASSKEALADQLAEDYSIDQEKSLKDIERMKQTIKMGKFPENYSDDFIAHAAFEYLKRWDDSSFKGTRDTLNGEDIEKTEDKIKDILEGKVL